jgi:hypothetical protein
MESKGWDFGRLVPFSIQSQYFVCFVCECVLYVFFYVISLLLSVMFGMAMRVRHVQQSGCRHVRCLCCLNQGRSQLATYRRFSPSPNH